MNLCVLTNQIWFVFVRDTAKELWEKLHSLEAIKYDHNERLKRQRYEVSEGAPHAAAWR